MKAIFQVKNTGFFFKEKALFQLNIDGGTLYRFFG